MANSATPLILLMLISLLAAIEGAQNSTELKWAKKLKTRKKTTSSETVTNLQFYFHDTLSGKTPSAVRVAQATDTEKSPTLFGALLMADDPLTETPDPNSKLVGRAQGLYGSSCQQELGLIMAMNFGFTDGMYNGSSISILGKNSAMNPVREMPVVAGTGVFRLGRGYAIAKTHWIDFTTGDAIVGYNVTVIH
ncbi:hypothetical protein PRUPE_8G162100 [Prunus persica]|uniref:Dirigent protein n=2 Tax=Prunus TaxID=3754 RepID=A0A4Y1QKT6_PRUDU|nr:dirigent protein 23 [Prunus persica]XP_034228565.1 dirigent protein 23-like [Prunus dulcis]KAI5315052.1 hypothetical protein L3X38_044228 [Prunus dulcis]ONH92199.1 hypothetical protein PRUPE_8G162100 [Prunus persica]VVA15641.1 PREDICTED: dirigent [Prunus dulcis]BBG92434.1 Disease resistance-responsive dirigent-like family protein [Prunus dulcis]BBH09790.1 Disease resistance-responsive dirigent-like family protein [Prunus dulcis]